MGRRPGDADRLVVTDETRPGLVAVLDLLGVGESALTDVAPYATRSRYTLELFGAEREALDDAAAVLGVSAKSGAKLARAIVRSWLVTPWHHPAQLAEHDFGDGHTWAQSLADVRAEATWPGQCPDPTTALVAALLRLPPAQRRAVFAVVASAPKPTRSR